MDLWLIKENNMSINLIKKLWNTVKTGSSFVIGKVVWKTSKVIKPDTVSQVRKLLSQNNYIILTRHNGHLSSYAIDFAHWVFTLKPGHYGHALLNVEQTYSETYGFEFIQATTPGVGFASFEDIFDQQCGSVCILKPKSLTIEEWSMVIDKAKTDIGKPYDLALDPSQTAALDCVELVRDALIAEPGYETEFAKLEAMIARHNTLDPQMYYEAAQGSDACFEIVFEARV
jgi:hypothetical protein